MINLVALGYLLLTIVFVGTFAWMSWDQIAASMRWPRPSYGAGLGVTYIAFLVNFLQNNKIVFGRTIADSADEEREAPTQGSDSSGT